MYTFCSLISMQPPPTSTKFGSIENGFKKFYPPTCTVLNRQTQPNMSDIENKPKRVITEEQKAKMKAGREAAKARKDAERVAKLKADAARKLEQKAARDARYAERKARQK